MLRVLIVGEFEGNRNLQMQEVQDNNGAVKGAVVLAGRAPN
jgi:hypothetical protein